MVAERRRLADGRMNAGLGERFGQFRACMLVHQVRRDAVRTGVRCGAAVRARIGQRLVAVLDGRVIDRRRSVERTGHILKIAQRRVLG